jgi:Zn-dependent protease with chaperone function
VRFVAKLPEETSNVSRGSPLVELVQLVVGGLAVLLLLVGLGGLAADAVAGRISPERERALFGAVTGTLTIERADDRERLERVMASLGPAEPRPVVGVMESDELNALALPGGAIVVTRALLDQVDDAELAFVVAHELAHLEHRDNLRAIGRAVVLTVALSVVGVESGLPVDAGELAGRVALHRFGRRRERAADAAAVRRLLARGLDATASVRPLERLADREGRGDRALAWLATHPLGTQRIDAARQLLGDR